MQISKAAMEWALNQTHQYVIATITANPDGIEAREVNRWNSALTAFEQKVHVKNDPFELDDDEDDEGIMPSIQFIAAARQHGLNHYLYYSSEHYRELMNAASPGFQNMHSKLVKDMGIDEWWMQKL